MCTICTRVDRADIENALVSMSVGAAKISIKDIADKFGVDEDELKTHALFHTPLVNSSDLMSAVRDLDDTENMEVHGSLVRAMKLKEADMLAAVSGEYLVTLKAMGRRINGLLNDFNDDSSSNQHLAVAKLLTKPMVELYLGLGGEIRQTVKTAAEVDRMLNGPKDGVTSSLAALADAIRGSDVLNG
jgi:hypothetical protein